MQNPRSDAPAPTLLIFGLGYSAQAIAARARADGWHVIGTRRQGGEPPDIITFSAAEPALRIATHVLSSVPPDAEGDPVLNRYRSAIAYAPRLRWVGYLSTTGVYGNRDGAWVDEMTVLREPESERAQRRFDAELAWAAFADKRPVNIFRLAGIYGPGRSVFDDIRSGRARRVIKPGHAFGRIHRDDIAAAVIAGMCQKRQPGVQVFNLTDDLPAESAEVMEEAAALLGVPAPPAVQFAEALATMSPMARSFWADNRRVSSRATQAELGLRWRYPTYREGLRAILEEERLNGVAQQSEVGGA
jgi:nucleoside-diphosphate-sugar epimerase